jgi:FAD/FMN-containing dehydrogenase
VFILAGISFFSPRVGFVCSSIASYEVALASGSVATASASTCPDLWRALKGGSNNFGIVTRFKARTIPVPGYGVAGCICRLSRPTLAAAHAAYEDVIPSLERAKPRVACGRLLFSNHVFQPLLPTWARKGYPNTFRFDDQTGEPLVVVAITGLWENASDEDLRRGVTRQAIEKMEAFAESNHTAHRYRYPNYCSDWQKPFGSYGEENLKFLRDISKKYEPDGLFKKGCSGALKLGSVDN